MGENWGVVFPDFAATHGLFEDILDQTIGFDVFLMMNDRNLLNELPEHSKTDQNGLKQSKPKR